MHIKIKLQLAKEKQSDINPLLKNTIMLNYRTYSNNACIYLCGTSAHLGIVIKTINIDVLFSF